jgi:hypothetical protein
MTRVDVLRSQASVLWRLAESFDIPLIRYDLRTLGARCEEMAEDLLREEAQPQESQNALP